MLIPAAEVQQWLAQVFRPGGFNGMIPIETATYTHFGPATFQAESGAVSRSSTSLAIQVIESPAQAEKSFLQGYAQRTSERRLLCLPISGINLKEVPDDQLTLGGQTWQIRRVKEMKMGTQVLLWELILA